MSKSEPELIRTVEAARLLGISVKVLRNVVASGRLRVFKIGPKSWRFDKAELFEFLYDKSAATGSAAIRRKPPASRPRRRAT